MSSCLVCISGGIDSIVLLKKAIKHFDSISCLTFQYPNRDTGEESIVKWLKVKFDFKWYDIQLPNTPTYMTMAGIALDICQYSKINYIGFGVIKDDLWFDDNIVYRGSNSFFHQIIRIGKHENILNINFWLPLKDMAKTDVISELNLKTLSKREFRSNFNIDEWKFKEL